MTMNYHSGIYKLEVSQTINASMNEVWNYFSNPHNLNELTPKNMNFEITSKVGNVTYQGQIITYSIQLVPLLKTNWVTEITHLENHKMFIDEQRFGPYAMWHHEHHFLEENGKVTMQDIISFKLPFGLLGRVLAAYFVKKRIKQIFDYRFLKINERFQ